ncbi:hypothetical protein O3S81_26160 [Agrobacterium sp. SOY23]|uniref:hypothetical protein n=1 Tax=Agrobacterium sp. SOY23 TaxID=3014555 RepID=UPI0022AF309F|nr:hypothetical protein [Agrobacterium sp. SOY23]MCZ4433196.1 hypothetical protein [Agrobacterium sp. SOY23]
MTVQLDRNFATDRVRRERATQNTKLETASWTRWEAVGPVPFEIHYERPVSFFVAAGRAEIAFSDGSRLDIQPDDFVTITPDIKGMWTIIEPITNLYMYQDTRSGV